MVEAFSQLAARRRLRVAGLMSGTSADGVSAAIVDVGRSLRHVRLLAHGTFCYPGGLRRRIFALFDPRTGKVDDICHLNFVLGEVFASAVMELCRQARIGLHSVDLIGSHGQTIQHLPRGRAGGGGLFGRALGPVRSTLQIGEPCVLAERTGITTVADFRPRDVAAGGQGAPLVPLADLLLFGHPKKSRAIQNLGGIANVTYLPAGGGLDDVLAFDTGPGNMIIDCLTYLASNGRRNYDRDGRLAAAGTVRQPLLAKLLRHPFLRRRPPKSTGREEFGAQFADRLWHEYFASAMGGTACLQAVSRHRRPPTTRLASKPCHPKDMIATATAFTAGSIADAYRRFLPGKVDEVILCGGGARNLTLVAMLREALAPAKVVDMAEMGLPPEAKEAVSFALLAVATIRGQAGNVPSATGARRPAVLGKIVPGR